MEAIKIDELISGARVRSVSAKLEYQSDVQATRRGVASWRVEVSLGDEYRRLTVFVTVWSKDAPSLVEGDVAAFTGVTVGATEKGRIWVTAESWAEVV
jgi:hypothetical protein